MHAATDMTINGGAGGRAGKGESRGEVGEPASQLNRDIISVWTVSSTSLSRRERVSGKTHSDPRGGYLAGKAVRTFLNFRKCSASSERRRRGSKEREGSCTNVREELAIAKRGPGRMRARRARGRDVINFDGFLWSL